MKHLLQTFILICIGILSSHAQTLVGVTQFGGTNGGGTVSKYVVESNELTTPLSFDGDGPSPSSKGGRPAGTLVQAINGKLYGLTNLGGSDNWGTLYSIDSAISAITKLHDFNTTDGIFPVEHLNHLIQATDGKLYGTAPRGGINDVGTIFSFDPVTGIFTKLRDMDFENGGNPNGALMQAADGKFYGLNNSGLGSIYSFDPASSTYTKLKDFDGTNGRFPKGSLIQANDGKLYGFTPSGGSLNTGVIFRYDPAIDLFTKLYDFDNVNGGVPQGCLLQASNGLLYGATNAGGSQDVGVLFAFDPTTSTYTKLQDFVWTNGANPEGGLMQASNGKLYGTAGVIYSFDPATAEFKREKDFGGTIGGKPIGELVEISVCATPTTYYQDTDGDGFGNPGVKLSASTQPTGYVKDSTDCDDTNNSVHGPSKYYYRDADWDGYGDPNSATMACAQPAGYVTNNKDCNDNNKAIHAPVTYYRDLDRDGFGDSFNSISVCSDIPPAGYIKNNYDCYDSGSISQPEYVRVRMCHDGWTQCVNVKDITEKISLGWTLGLCALQSCAADETLMCHNGKQECVKTKDVPNLLAETDGKWWLGPTCGGTHISGNTLNKTTNAARSGKEQLMPTTYKIYNYPNPFTGISTIYYELPLDSKVSIKVYDLIGREVTTLVDEYKKAGIYSVKFNAGRYGAGVMYYRITAKSSNDQFEQTNKMILVR